MESDDEKLEDLLGGVGDENIHDEEDTGDAVGLEALSAAKSARKLAELGGSEPHLDPIPRRKSKF